MTPAGDAPAGAVASVSALAAALVAAAAPVRFGVATSAGDVAAACQLRYEVAVGQGWTAADAFPDGLERDADDAAAVHIAGWDGHGVVATARIVQPVIGRPLPTEAAFDFVLGERNRLVDIGRICVASTYRDASHRVFRGVLGQLWREMCRLGYREAATAVTGPVARMYERWGIGVTILGPPRMYWGALRYPARMTPAATVDRLLSAVAPSRRATPA